MIEDVFCGHPVSYWLELKKIINDKSKDFNAEYLIQEISDLRSKVSFYESRINELNIFMIMRKEIK
jgi:hypothetical protein